MVLWSKSLLIKKYKLGHFRNFVQFGFSWCWLFMFCFTFTNAIPWWVCPRNPYWKGRISTVDLLILSTFDHLNLTFFIKQPILIRRSTILSKPLLLVFPGLSIVGLPHYFTGMHYSCCNLYFAAAKTGPWKANSSHKVLKSLLQPRLLQANLHVWFCCPILQFDAVSKWIILYKMCLFCLSIKNISHFFCCLNIKKIPIF